MLCELTVTVGCDVPARVSVWLFLSVISGGSSSAGCGTMCSQAAVPWQSSCPSHRSQFTAPAKCAPAHGHRWRGWCHPLLPLTLTSPGRKLCASEGWVGQDSCSSRHSSVWHPWHEAVETQSVCPHFFQVTPL